MRRIQIIAKVWHLLLAGFVVILLGRCSGDTYIGEKVTDEEISYSEPIPIEFSFGFSDYTWLSTRGSGPIDPGSGSDEFWKNAPFYVYAFNGSPKTDLSVRWADNEDFCLLDAGRGETGNVNSLHGKLVLVKPENSHLLTTFPDKVYYNMQNTDLAYNFFAYFLDNKKEELEDYRIRREKDRIYYDVAIDGSTDYMTSMANPNDEETVSKYSGNPLWKDIRERAYSAYSAIHGLQPVFKFKHHMVRLKFVICRPDPDTKDPSGQPMPPPSIEGTQLRVDFEDGVGVDRHKGISVKTKVEGRFTVALNQIDETDENKRLGMSYPADAKEDYVSLKGDNQNLLIEECKTKEEAQGIIKGDSKEDLEALKAKGLLKGDLLLAAADSYQAKISLQQDSPDDAPDKQRNNVVYVTLSPPKGESVFKEGKIYYVYLTINSLSDVTGGVSLKGWDAVDGDVHVNEKDEFEDTED